jgi:hypothetical protein
MNVFTTDCPMTSKPSAGMLIATLLSAFMALLFFVVAGWSWHRWWVQKHMRKPVLEMPIRFEEGFSFTSSFSVRYANYYWVEVVCPRANSSRSQLDKVFGDLSRELPIKFTITCNGVTVAEGDSRVEKTRVGSAAEDTRMITNFKGESGQRYDVYFRTIGALPALDATKPTLRIRCFAAKSLVNMLFYYATPPLIISAVGLLFAISPVWFLARKCFPQIFLEQFWAKRRGRVVDFRGISGVAASWRRLV